MQDASIMIYSVPLKKVINRMSGHMNRITGLAFSSALNLLVSPGADHVPHFFYIYFWADLSAWSVSSQGMPSQWGLIRSHWGLKMMPFPLCVFLIRIGYKEAEGSQALSHRACLFEHSQHSCLIWSYGMLDKRVYSYPPMYTSTVS